MTPLLGWDSPAAPVWIIVGLSVLLAVCVGVSKKARAATWTPYVALVLLLVGLWFGRFDGQPRPGTFYDGTVFAWMFCVVARIPMGMTLMLLGPLIARAAVSVVGERKALTAGALASLPLATGLVVSGYTYLSRAWGIDVTPSVFRSAYVVANAFLIAGACMSLVIAMLFVAPVFNRRPLGSPRTF